MRKTVLILYSGTGSTAVAVARELKKDKNISVHFISNKFRTEPESIRVFNWVYEQTGISTIAIPKRRGENPHRFFEKLEAACESFDPDLIVLAGFMKILPPEFVQEFQGRILNLHPSLLPKFPGLHTHQRFLESDETEHGFTIHVVDEGVDTGDIVFQKVVIKTERPCDLTVEEIEKAVKIEEKEYYPQIVRKFLKNRISKF